MYLDCEIKIPVVPGRINQIKKGKTTYIRYVLKRTYHADKKYNVPEQKVIGKRSETSSELMIPNENFIKYFADIELPVMKKRQHKEQLSSGRKLLCAEKDYRRIPASRDA